MNINSWLFLTRFVNSLTIIESISTIMNNCAVIHTLAGNPLEFFGLVYYTFQNFHGVKAYNTLKKLYQILHITDVLVFFCCCFFYSIFLISFFYVLLFWFFFIFLFWSINFHFFLKDNMLGFQTKWYNSSFVVFLTLGREIFFSNEWLYLASLHHIDKLY